MDIGIAAPHAGHAGDDCLETMAVMKRRKYARYESEMAEQGIVYRPLTFSCYGRRHPDTTQFMKEAAAKAARCKGIKDHKALYRRWSRAVTAEVWRRAGRMVLACLKRGDDGAEWPSGAT